MGAVIPRLLIASLTYVCIGATIGMPADFSIMVSTRLLRLALSLRRMRLLSAIPLSEIAYIKNYFDYGKEKK